MPGTKWVVRGKLGQGGMGLVLSVEKAGLIRGAMKVLLPAFAKLPEFAAKFLAEVKVTARLQHPSIVQVLDFDRLADGTPFMVMERLRGRTLRAALRETRERGKLWTAANTYAVAAQAAEGLYRAHSLEPSIVHRDVKPENIFLHRSRGVHDSVVKVMDFGVAAVVGERDRQNIGTPRYMAPEQMDGGEVSPQTDQYALALVIYEMLTGRLPWDVNLRDPKALAEAHRHAAPTPPSQFCPWLPARMDAALLKALSKDPARAARHAARADVRAPGAAVDWRSPGMTGDANTTDPGTLAEGGAVVRDEPDPLERMPAPHAKRPPLAAAGPTSASEMTELSDSWEPPTWPLPQRAGPLARQPSVPVALGDPAASESITTAAPARGLGRPRARGPGCARYADDRRVRPGPRAADPKQGRAREDGPRAGGRQRGGRAARQREDRSLPARAGDPRGASHRQPGLGRRTCGERPGARGSAAAFHHRGGRRAKAASGLRRDASARSARRTGRREDDKCPAGRGDERLGRAKDDRSAATRAPEPSGEGLRPRRRP